MNKRAKSGNTCLADMVSPMINVWTKYGEPSLKLSCGFSNFSAISWREQVNFQRNDDDVCFVLEQQAELDFYSASSLKQSPHSDTLS